MSAYLNVVNHNYMCLNWDWYMLASSSMGTYKGKARKHFWPYPVAIETEKQVQNYQPWQLEVFSYSPNTQILTSQAPYLPRSHCE